MNLEHIHVVMLNGAPSSGKDTAAYAIINRAKAPGPWRWERFSFPLKEAAHSLFGHPVNQFGIGRLESKKELPISELGVSYRQFQIDMSEKFMKKEYGDDIFGRLLAHRIKRLCLLNNHPVFYVVPDSGFLPELRGLQNNLAGAKFLLLRCTREGTSFSGDSRSHIEPLDGVDFQTIENGEDVEIYKLKAIRAVEQWIGSLGR